MRVLYFLSVAFEFSFDIEYIETDKNIADKPSRVPASLWLQDESECSPLRTRLPVQWLPPHPLDSTWEANLAARAFSVLAARQ